jgi:hypothetical protein
VIAVMLHVILGATLSIVSWRGSDTPFEGAAIVLQASHPAPPLTILEEEPPLVRKAPPPVDPVELVEPKDADQPYLPDADPDLTQPIGDPDADPNASDLLPSTPTNIGAGLGPGHRGVTGTQPPRPNRGSTKVGRPAIAAPQATEEAVLYGLRWLVRHQAEDGAWSIAHLRDVCADGTCLANVGERAAHYDEGLTALALLAFLGAGHGHDSQALVVDDVKGRAHKLGEVVKHGLRRLCDLQKPDGSFSAQRPFLYNEALCAMALSEAYWMSGARTWRANAQRVVDFLVAAQKRDPSGAGFWGWRYAPREDRTVTDLEGDAEALAALHESDLSVTTWAVMALKSAQLAGLAVPDESLDGALAFVRWVSSNDGRAGYLTPDGAGLAISGVDDHFVYHPAAMSALAMCSRTFLAHDADDPFLGGAAAQLVRDPPARGEHELSIDYYYWYYGSLALYQFDGPESPKHSDKFWGPWQKELVRTLVELQAREKGRCSHGAWLTPDRWSHTGGPLYATALNVLTLEVYYRYDNAFGVRPERATKPRRR